MEKGYDVVDFYEDDLADRYMSMFKYMIELHDEIIAPILNF